MHIEATDKLQAWQKTVEFIKGFPVTTDERGEKVRQNPTLLDVLIRNPEQAVTWPTWSFASGPGMGRYKDEMFNMDAQGFDYTYGQRLGFQIKDIIERLQKVPQSRRLAYVILEPHDLDRDLAMPCLISGVFANVKGTLNHVAYYRSWDVVGGMPANLEALQGLTEKVAHETKKTPGWLNVVAMNAHIRGDDFDKL